MTPRYNPDDRLIETEQQQLGQRIPKLLHERVEALCDIAYAAGERKRPGKAEMIGAIILSSRTDPDDVREILSTYAAAKAKEALPQTADAEELPEGTVIELPRRNPGPRSPGKPGPVIHAPDEDA